MNCLAVVLFLSVAITLSQAQNNQKDLKQEQTNFLFNRVETLRKTAKLFGKIKVNTQFYAIETDTKLANLSLNKRGLLIKLLQHRDGTQIREILINTNNSEYISSATDIPTALNPDNNNVKMPLNIIDKIADIDAETKSNEYQYDYFSSQVAIFSWPVTKNSIPMCAGSLISNRYVLTAANCVENEKRVVLVFGARNIQKQGTFQVKVESSNFKIHKKWDSMTLKSNIALIELPESIKFNEYISAVNLPTKADENKTFIDYNATLVAWSSDHERIMKPVNTTDVIISNVKCFFSYQSMILSSHICLASSISNCSCVGESGDQLIVQDDGIMKLIGLLSFGMINGCTEKTPVVFTRITAYLPWIESHTKMSLNTK